jgi:hypothetical protein
MEVKTQWGTQSKKLKAFAESLREAGGINFLVKSDG